MKYLIPIFILVVIFLMIPVSVLAQDGSVDKVIDLLSDVSIFLWVIGLGIGLIMIIISGIQYMTAGGDETKTGKAKKMLTYTLIGIAIVVAANFILGMVRDFLIDRGMGGVPGV